MVDEQVLEIDLRPERFPCEFSSMGPKLNAATAHANLAEGREPAEFDGLALIVAKVGAAIGTPTAFTATGGRLPKLPHAVLWTDQWNGHPCP